MLRAVFKNMLYVLIIRMHFFLPSIQCWPYYWLQVLQTQTSYLCFCLLFRNHLQILLLILRKFKRLTDFCSPLKSWKNLWFPLHFRGNKSLLIRLNLLNIKRKIWGRSLTGQCFLQLFLMRYLIIIMLNKADSYNKLLIIIILVFLTILEPRFPPYQHDR